MWCEQWRGTLLSIRARDGFLNAACVPNLDDRRANAVCVVQTSQSDEVHVQGGKMRQ